MEPRHIYHASMRCEKCGKVMTHRWLLGATPFRGDWVCCT